MAEPLKEQFFTSASMNKLADTLTKFYPVFDKKRFLNLVFDTSFKAKELKEKMHHTTECLHIVLPESYPEALEILKKAAPLITGFESLSLPDFVELCGMEDWDLSLPALKHFTRYSSSELAIRPFIAQDPERVMAFMNDLTEDENKNVRRFASEGCRPRLPWAMGLPGFKKDPGLILPILEKLKDDESEFVRRSVANNLNDISKDHPDLALDIFERWYGHSPKTDEIVKHACRTLLKAGNKRALILFGFSDPANMKVEKLKLDKEMISIGQDLRFSFDLCMNEKKKSRVRLEYIVHYVKAKGKISKKVFQIIEKEYAPGRHKISRKQSFIDMTTRKHYPGKHQIAIMVNGVEKSLISFDLM